MEEFVITLTINDKTIHTQVGRSILEVARDNAIWIPTLCYHEALKPYGGCRLCLVELETQHGSRVVSSCTFPAEDGMVVHTNTKTIQQSRQIVAQLLLARAGHVPFIRELAASVGVNDTPYTLPQDTCVLCARCVRACQEIVGMSAISIANRGSDRVVVPPFKISSADCIECTTCVLVCPTDAITLDDISDSSRTVHEWQSEYARGACRLCEYTLNGN